MLKALIHRRKPIIHDMTGIMGYPVLLIAMNDDWHGLLVEHYSDQVAMGDQMIVGRNLLTSRTYWVLLNREQRAGAWQAHLEAVAPIPVTILGRAY
jgi:hypothetical protein